MRFKKKHIKEVNLSDKVEKAIQSVRDTLDTDDDGAKKFIKDLSGIEEAVQGDKVVQFHSERSGEEPFMLNGIKWQYVNAIYPDGKKDIGVYRFDQDLAYDFQWFMDEVVPKPKSGEDVREDESGSASRGIEYGQKEPEVGEREYEDLRNLLRQMAQDSDDDKTVSEVNAEVMNKFIDQYGEERGKQIYYATANKQDRDPETFEMDENMRPNPDTDTSLNEGVVKNTKRRVIKTVKVKDIK